MPSTAGTSTTTTSPTSAVDAVDVTHRYGERVALDRLSLNVAPGEIFGLLGPNGSGKSTLFRILSTALDPTSGSVRLLGDDARANPALRRRIGVVFQSPALDPKLTVRENLRYHGMLYGISGSALRERIASLLPAFGLQDRADEIVEKLSGGLKRRVELAKALVPQPTLLLLDEPTTGLDPNARRDFWDLLAGLRDVTILLTTHLMEDAERCTRLAILDGGKVVAMGTPGDLKREIGGDVVTFAGRDPGALKEAIAQKFGLAATIVDGAVRVEHASGHAFAAEAAAALGDRISSVTVGRPTLDDVFFMKTGRRLREST